MSTEREAEQAVLGSLLMDGALWHQVAGKLNHDDFQSQNHREIFKAIRHLGDEGNDIDVITIAEHLENHSEIDRVGGLTYLAELTQKILSTKNIESYADIVRSNAKLHRLLDICSRGAMKASESGDKTADEIVSEIQLELDGLSATGGTESYEFIDVLSEADDAIQEAKEKARKGESIGVPTGLPALDRQIGGLPKKRLIILAGRPGLGKTALAQQIALHAASRGFSIGIASLEMGADELGIRAYANRLQVNGTALSYGNEQAIKEYSSKLIESGMSRFKIFADPSTYSLSGIVARAHEWKHKNAIDMLVVDHIGLVEVDGNTANERLGNVTRTLKKLAKRLDIPVLALCQLNRNVEKEKREPMLADLRDSGSIEQDCDVALFLHATTEELDGSVLVQIGALKTRYGKKGWLHRGGNKGIFKFDGKFQRFTEITTDYQQQYSKTK